LLLNKEGGVAFFMIQMNEWSRTDDVLSLKSTH
jgi:hypothetical protein